MTNIDRKNPVLVTIKERIPLSKTTSSKETYQITLDIKNKPLHFTIGDSLGIYAQNDPLLIDHLLAAMKATGDEVITYHRFSEKISVRQLLTSKANLSRISSSFLKLLHEHSPFQDKKNHLHSLLQIENKPALLQYLALNDPLNILKQYSEIQTPLEELCNQFSPLLPRFYSAASSLKTNPDEIDLVVSVSTYTQSGEMRYGVASHFLSHLAIVGQTEIPIYVQPAHRFRLPLDLHADIIMVGPGTGIAPFRGFLQERLYDQAKGRHWLFFGERNQSTDFYYETYLKDLEAQNKLKLSIAFSRDQSHKVYVQHKMLKNAKELWKWLENGAYFYVCGDAEEMAKEVDLMLHQIVATEGKKSLEETKAYVKMLRSSQRYQTDVY